MKATPPTTDSKHQAVVTMTPRPGGGACYSIEVTAASEAVIRQGAAIEQLSPAEWLASSVNIRIACTAAAVLQMAENTENQTIN